MAITFLDGPRGRLRVCDGGEGGVAAVLIHGGAARLEQWTAQLRHLRRSRRALALDLPGMGESEPPRDGDWTVEAMAEAVLAAAEVRGLSRFVLMGHSFGGNVLAACLAAAPERVAGVVLVDTGAWIPTGADLEEMRQGFRPAVYQRFMEAWFRPILAGGRPETVEAVLASLRATSREAFMAATYGMAGFDMAAPVLAWSGPRLAICAEGLNDMASRWKPPVEVVVMPGPVSHWLHMDRPEEFNALLDRFLARIPG